MISIVIVDDEVLVRQGIKYYIENSGEDMEIAAIFANAKDAIEYLSNNSVQILITDIEMAQMDGIELIRHCVNFLYPMGIIVLSCHDNFEYARDVFALGADAYVLKHEVSQEELISKIKKANVRIQNISRVPYQDATFGNRTSTQEAQIWDSGNYALLKICIRAKYEKYVKVRTNADRKIICDVITEIFSSNELGQVIQNSGNIYIRIGIANGKGKDELRIKAKFAEKHLCTNILNYFNERIYLAVSDLLTEEESFQVAQKQVNKASEIAFYDTNQSLFFFSDIGNRLHDLNSGFYTERIDLTSHDWRAEVETDINNYFIQSQKKQLPPKIIIQNMQGFIYKLEDHLYRYYNTSMYEFLPDSMTSDDSLLDGLDTFYIVRDYVLFIIDRAIEFVYGMRDNDAVFSKIIEYIDSHYATAITLTTLCEIFHTNQSYLCKVFRNKKKTSFISYLNQVRIGHVKRLLASSSLSVDKIAEMIGFNNANYLVRVFKKTTGKTIGEYRKQLKS